MILFAIDIRKYRRDLSVSVLIGYYFCIAGNSAGDRAIRVAKGYTDGDS